MTGFVNDTTHWINNFDCAINGNYSTQEMYWNTQTTAQWWEQLLYSTGGKLELPNFFFYTIFWKFDGVPSLDDTNNTRNIGLISSEDGKNERIQQKSPYESHKTLRVMENPSRNYEAEYQSIKNKSDKWRTSISDQYMNRHESSLFYSSF